MSPVLIIFLALGWIVAAGLALAWVLRTQAKPVPGDAGRADRLIECLQCMFDNAAVECYLETLDGTLVYANPAAASSLGYTVAELLATGMAGIDPVQGKRCREQAEGLRQRSFLPYETVHLAKNGRKVSKEMRSALLPGGDHDYVLGIGQDISALKGAEDQQQEPGSRARQVERLESLATLAGGVAHDFSSVLTAVLGNLDMALDDLPSDAPARVCINEAAAAGRRAASLTRQMLAFSGRGRMRLAALDVGQLLDAALPRLCALVPQNVTVTIDVAPGLPAVMVDAAQLQQALVDLVANARDAIGEQPGTITISALQRQMDAGQLAACLAARPPVAGDYVVVTVKDSGCGMAADVLDRAFDPFFSSKQGGRGLGLPMALGIAKGFRGGVLLASQPGKGTTVSVLIPVPVQVPTATAAEPLQSPPTTAFQPRGVMLVVDDEDSVRSLTARMATRMGFDVLTATDGVEAVEIYAKHANEVRCIILDLFMPRMDGVATFTALRTIRPDAKIILCSGFSDPDRTQQVIVTGARGHLPKPFSYAQFQDAVERAIGNSGGPS